MRNNKWFRMRNRVKIRLIMKFTLIFFVVPLLFMSCKKDVPIPQEWLSQWQSPSADYRPLQIVHDKAFRTIDEETWIPMGDHAIYLRDSCGLGGGENYLRSEESWNTFVDYVKKMRERNMRVWISDDDGYPSFPAGGLVLQGHPELESQEMVYDKTHTPMFYSRPSYEYTHASNSFAGATRYPNPLNKLATERFIKLTHEAYLQHLGQELFSEVEAFYSDEPSLMAVKIADQQHSPQVKDPIDLTKKELPRIPWEEDIHEKYKQKYNEDLMPHLLSLFEGDKPFDKNIRRNYWELMGELDKAYFYDTIENWFNEFRIEHQNKGPVFSGHGLREESIITHVPLEGNMIQILSAYGIPGIDLIDSNPKAWMADNASFGGNWQAPAFGVSVAQLTGKRRVVCEMNDFMQSRAGDKIPVRLEDMQASSAWLVAWGITDFTLYYVITYGEKFPYRNESSHKAYCDFIGRVTSITKKAKPIKSVLLYYPIYDMQGEYQPTATTISLDTQSEKVQQIENSFHQIGVSLTKSQIPFILIDYLYLEQAKITNKGTIDVNGEEYDGLILPRGVLLPPQADSLVERMKEKGVSVISVDQNNSEEMVGEQISLLVSAEKLIPSQSDIVFGKFTRDGHEIYMLVNTGTEMYQGNLTILQKGNWTIMDPQTSEITKINSTSENGKTLLPINLKTKQTLIYVSNANQGLLSQ